MIPTSSHIVGTTPQAMPMALIFSSRLLLTEKSSVVDDGLSSGVRTETLAIRATMATSILQEMPCWSHGGINE
jgi:hypothetical protein